jgi:hypothetical protein
VAKADNLDTTEKTTIQAQNPSPAESNAPETPSSEAPQKANAKRKKIKKSKTNSPAIAPPMTSDSQGIRRSQRQNYSFLFTPLSDLFLSYGAQAHYIKSPKLQIGFLALSGTMTKSYATTSFAGSSKAQGSVLSINPRYFFGNSFNVMTGLGYRSINIEWKFTDKSLSAEIDTKVKVSGVALPIFTGNHWTWSNGFTIGVDWIGAWIPLSPKSVTSVSGTAPDSLLEEFSDIVQDELGKISNKTTFTLALTSIGWAF